MATKKIYTHRDYNQNELRNFTFEKLASDPTPFEGQIWENTTEKKLKTYLNGTVETIAFLSNTASIFGVDLLDSEASVVRTFAGGETSYAVTHGFTTKNIQVSVYEISTDELVDTGVVATSTTVATIVFNGNSTDGLFRVVIIG